MTMTINDLPQDLVEEILCRVPVKSIGVVRSTCKNWNVLSKDERFANKHIDRAAAAAREKEYLIITAGGSMDYLTSVNLYETRNKNFDLSINRKGISIEREHSEEIVFISQAFFSNGLLLCVWRNNENRLLVWNPYWGKRRWIECPPHCLNERFAFGYDRSCGSHKILRFSNDNPRMEIFYLRSDSWRTYDASFNRNTIKYNEPGMSLKGNTYWYVTDYESEDGFLHCFDFTRESFGPRLPLPPCSHSFHTV
ncbi:putative F-box/kelch-repeat protein [Raphanus sativus]|uniref:F-box protein At3g20705 n=1 Tax=Raphanus sativus TaxID=3726 RepID=A0A9W3CPW4_RAPSA|nr:putative F-box protein At3g20705 [Raphanus sativus]KAJ4871279.1 putative F-box/kelch-repeat protein [Raphanus sativus]